MQGINDHLGIHASALELRSRRTDILASNIANAATPHFKARDLDFAAEIRKHMNDGPLTTTASNHLPAAVNPRPDRISYRVPTTPAKDGNTVELSVEQMQFSENVMRYQTSLNFLNRKITGLLSAIKEE
ncbi:MAG: flagellar basal body rod protein FlgB [Phycisphaerales bacterium]